MSPCSHWVAAWLPSQAFSIGSPVFSTRSAVATNVSVELWVREIMEEKSKIDTHGGLAIVVRVVNSQYSIVP